MVSKWTIRDFGLSGIFAAITFGLAFALGAGIITATGIPATGGIANIFIAVLVVLIGMQICPKFGFGTLTVGLIFTFAIPTVIGGPPGAYKVVNGLLIGLVLDVAQGTVLGQHALALSLVAYITVKFHLQLRVFPVSQMTATVFAMLALYQFILFWINGVAGINAAAMTYWGPVISGAVIWPMLAIIYGSVRYRVRG